MALKQLLLGAPSLLGKAADEALGLFGSVFPLTLNLTNQTPSAHQFHVPDCRVEAGDTVAVTFDSVDVLGTFANNAQQIGHLFGVDDAFVLAEADAADKPARKKKAAADADTTDTTTATDGTAPAGDAQAGQGDTGSN